MRRYILSTKSLAALIIFFSHVAVNRHGFETNLEQQRSVISASTIDYLRRTTTNIKDKVYLLTKE